MREGDPTEAAFASVLESAVGRELLPDLEHQGEASRMEEHGFLDVLSAVLSAPPQRLVEGVGPARLLTFRVTRLSRWSM